MPGIMRSILLRVAGLLAIPGLLVAPVALSAQHEYTASDVENGGRLFLGSCAGCHGPDGDGVSGVDLGHGQFRRASSDEDLVRIIRTGIPNTGMPPNNVSEVNAANIVAYLRSIAAAARSTSAAGDAGRGRTIFESKGNCASCHRVRGVGSRIGPDLTEVGAVRRAVELEQSILEPAAVVQPSHRSFRVVTRDGEAISGRLLNHDLFTVQLLDSKEQLRSFQTANLREYAFVDGSPMPSYRDKLTAEELADLVSYLVSLKGQVTP
jgi:putative heme-binding domain-containing protein